VDSRSEKGNVVINDQSQRCKKWAKPKGLLAISLKKRIMWEVVVESGKSAGMFLAFAVLKDE
jgi:hypothetical protein